MRSRHSFNILGGLFLAACTNAAPEGVQEASEPVSHVVAAVDLGAGHKVELRRSSYGPVTWVEQTPADTNIGPGVMNRFNPAKDSVVALFEQLSERSVSKQPLDPATLAELREIDQAQASKSKVGVVASALSGDEIPEQRVIDHNKDHGDFDWWKDTWFPNYLPRIFETGLTIPQSVKQTWCYTQGHLFNESATEYDARLSLNWVKPCSWPSLCSGTPPLLEQINAAPRMVMSTGSWEVDDAECATWIYSAEGSRYGWALEFEQIPID